MDVHTTSRATLTRTCPPNVKHNTPHLRALLTSSPAQSARAHSRSLCRTMQSVAGLQTARGMQPRAARPQQRALTSRIASRARVLRPLVRAAYGGPPRQMDEVCVGG